MIVKFHPLGCRTCLLTNLTDKGFFAHLWFLPQQLIDGGAQKGCHGNQNDAQGIFPEIGFHPRPQVLRSG